MHRRILLSVLFLITGAWNLSAQSIQISGIVSGPGGGGVGGVTIEVSPNVVPANPVTAGDGSFSFAVAPGVYDLDFLPPSSNLAPRRLEAVSLSSTTNLGTISLLPGFALSGTVTDQAGQPQVNVDMNVYDQQTGVKLFTPGDNTDASGNYSVIVPAGTFRVRANALSGSGLASAEVFGVVVNGATTAPAIVLPPGVVLSGTVRDAVTQQPLANVDIDVDDALTGLRLPTSNDDTDAGGNFSVIVPGGLYHVSFEPLPGVAIQGRRVLNVQVAGATSLGTVLLDPGFILSGTVLAAGGQPVVDADVDVDSQTTGARVFTPNDDTDVAGDFAVVVPAGTYVLRIEPRVGDGLVGARTAAVTVAANTVAPTVTLSPGAVVSGTVFSWFGGAEAGAVVEFLDPATGQELITPGNVADGGGQYAAIVPAGTWDVRVRAARIGLSQDRFMAGVTVAGNATLNHFLALAPASVITSTFGIPVVGQGGPVNTDFVFFTASPVPVSTLVSLVLIDPLGVEMTILPPSPFVIPPQQLLLLLNAPLPILPVSPALLGLEFELEVRLADPGTFAVFDRDRVEFIVQ